MRAFIVFIFLACAGCATTGSPSVDKAKMAEGYYMKGLSHFQTKNYELALVEFNRSIQADSNNKMSYYYLGYVNDLMGKLEDAEKYYKEALDIDAEFSEAYNALGTVYSRQQKWKDALKAYKKALENKLYTTPSVPYFNMGRMYMAQHDYEKAAEAYRDAKRYESRDIIIYELGTALYEAGKIKEAIKEFQEGVALSPANANMRYSLAVAFLKDGIKGAAAAEFKKAAELAPGSEIARKANDYLKTLR